MEVQAVAKYVRRTPRKARLIADSVKGMPVTEALALLEFSPRHAATDVAKVIKSAAANAEHNFNLNREDLFLKLLLVDEGPTMKRIRPVSRGMAHQYFRRTCHITAIVEDRPQEAQRRQRRPAAPAAAESPAPRRRRPAAPKKEETKPEETAAAAAQEQADERAPETAPATEENE
jgi:large subunit ribosomal protein L22